MGYEPRKEKRVGGDPGVLILGDFGAEAEERE